MRYEGGEGREQALLSVTEEKSDKIPFLNVKKWNIGKWALKYEK